MSELAVTPARVQGAAVPGERRSLKAEISGDSIQRWIELIGRSDCDHATRQRRRSRTAGHAEAQRALSRLISASTPAQCVACRQRGDADGLPAIAGRGAVGVRQRPRCAPRQSTSPRRRRMISWSVGTMRQCSPTARAVRASKAGSCHAVQTNCVATHQTCCDRAAVSIVRRWNRLIADDASFDRSEPM